MLLRGRGRSMTAPLSMIHPRTDSRESFSSQKLLPMSCVKNHNTQIQVCIWKPIRDHANLEGGSVRDYTWRRRCRSCCQPRHVQVSWRIGSSHVWEKVGIICQLVHIKSIFFSVSQTASYKGLQKERWQYKWRSTFQIPTHQILWKGGHIKNYKQNTLYR